MKLFNTVISSVLIASVTALPIFPRAGGADNLSLAQIDALTPQFGINSGVNPDGTGNCDGAVIGANGKPVQVPCDCPPARDLFIQDLAANIAAGHAVNNTGVAINFPTDDSTASQLARITAASITLQNLRGAGVGCPVAATTFTAQANALQDGTAAPPATPPSSSPASPPPASTTGAAPPAQSSPASGSGANGLSFQQIDQLTPQFGFQSGVNPTGSGDCDGAVDGANGQPIKVPCSCPPDRTLFINDMAANIAAGHAVNNTGVAVTFPTDDSTASQLARITAASITLQNLFGSGKGCPVASTTFSAQAQAIQNGQSQNAVAAAPPAKSSAAAKPASTPAAAPPSSAPAPSSNGAGLSIAQLDQLAPQFGHAAGVNPTGTGDCDGAVNGADGKPVKVPCTCPPARDQFLQSLQADVNAGEAVNNPSVKVSFPTDNSKNSQIARIQSSLIALQNLFGEGKGCPAASTTFSAQLKALTG